MHLYIIAWSYFRSHEEEKEAPSIHPFNLLGMEQVHWTHSLARPTYFTITYPSLVRLIWILKGWPNKFFLLLPSLFFIIIIFIPSYIHERPSVGWLMLGEARRRKEIKRNGFFARKRKVNEPYGRRLTWGSRQRRQQQLIIIMMESGCCLRPAGDRMPVLVLL